jgi:gamma-glutamyl hydrolase
LCDRNEFEWGPLEKLLKTPAAIRAMQYIADFFVTEVRNNHHKFPTVQEETAALIYNYAPTYTGDDTSDDTPDQQTYYFNLTM